MKFTGYKEEEIELSNEFVKMYGCNNKAVAEIIGSNEDFVESVKKGGANLNPQQFIALLKEYGIGEFEPRRGAKEKEQRMYAMITNLLKLLYRSMHDTL